MPPHIGLRIHALRSRQGLTLEVLARGSGVSRAMLSDVERGQRSPTVKILTQIAVGLGCQVAQLFEEEATARLFVERADQHALVAHKASGVERRTLPTPDLPPGIELVWYLLPAGTAMHRGPDAVRYVSAQGKRSAPFPPNPQGSGEHVTVLSGSVTLTDPDGSRALKAGDCASYRLTCPLTFTNTTARPCRLSLILDTHRLQRS